MPEAHPAEPRRPLIQPRILAVALHDVGMAAAAFLLAVWLRYQLLGAGQPFGFLWEGAVVFAAIAAVAFRLAGMYRGIWRYASASDLTAIARGVTLALLVFLPVMFTLTRLEDVPRSAVALTWPLLVLLLAGPRLAYRYAKDGTLAAAFDFAPAADRRAPVLLAGAGDQADLFIREMARGAAPWRVVGIVDDKPHRVGRDIRGVRVLGLLDDIDRVIAELEKRGRRPQRLVIASGRYDGERVRRLLEAAERHGMALGRMPRLTDLGRSGGGARGAVEIRPVDVEDLLGRPQKQLDREAMRALIAGRRVCVTGAGGTIGSELCRQIAALGPANLTLLENGEHALWQIDLELGERFPALARRAVLADVREAERMAEVLAAERPELLFHAAAFKHVPLVEANPDEGVLTNAIGTQVTAEAARAAGVRLMVLISTDKAVNPSSVMGATKRLAEMAAQGLGLSGGPTRFVTGRFGNVLGSTGSVVPLFQRQLARGGPLTVTHPDITRFFMTTREAVELVLQASALPPEPGEAGKIHVLDMGEPVRIQDLARQMIRLAGLRPDADVKIAYTGLRPGAKLHEELFHDGEPAAPARAPGLLLASPRTIDWALLRPQLARLAEAARARRTADTLSILARLVPEWSGADAGASSAAQ